MKIFSALQIKQWDAYTIEHEPISSIDLMARAAFGCTEWLTKKIGRKQYKIFCGNGNNGGDGLAIAALLIKDNRKVSVYILNNSNEGSPDFNTNHQTLKSLTNDVHYINDVKDFPEINNEDTIIDALFGTGLNKAISGVAADLIGHINISSALVIAIDLPSGLFADTTSIDNPIIKASTTLTFQQYKLALLIAENEQYFGKVILIDIGLHLQYYNENESKYQLTDPTIIKNIYKPRKDFSNKGNYGHALLMAGSYGMTGAAVLAAKGCLKSGAGKVTCLIPKAGYEIMQISVPEAMCIISGKKYIKGIADYNSYSAIGIGPGIGLHSSHKQLLQVLFENYKKPVVIDADALNTISEHNKLLYFLPANSIITPHPKEFDKLFGKSDNDFARIETAIQRAKDHNIFILLKGHRTFIAGPSGDCFFNSTGNAGMARGGSGDVLTGIITSLLAQGYTSLEACLFGAYLHGKAGDFAALQLSQESMTASDIIELLPKAFK